MWKLNDDWQDPITQVFDLNHAISSTDSPATLRKLCHRLFAMESTSTSDSRLSSLGWLKDLLETRSAPKTAPENILSSAVGDIFNPIPAGKIITFKDLRLPVQPEDRYITNQATWANVQHSLAKSPETHDMTRYDHDFNIERYYAATSILQEFDNGYDMDIFPPATIESLNKLRIYVLSLGMGAFGFYKDQKITHKDMPDEFKKYILPPFRLLNDILYYFYFQEKHRKEFLAQFSQILLACSYRKRVPFFNNDIVEYGNNIYRVVDDGYGVDDNRKQFQTTITLKQILQLNSNPVLADASNTVNAIEVDLVTGIDFIKEYGFVLPGCQSLHRFQTYEPTLIDIVNTGMSIFSTTMSYIKRVELAMTYFRTLMGLADVLMASMAQVYSWSEIDTTKPLEMTEKADFGGGQKIQGGGLNLFKIASDMIDSLSNLFKTKGGVDPGLEALGREADEQGNVDNVRSTLPELPNLDNLLGAVTYMDKASLGILDKSESPYNAFIITKLDHNTSPIQTIMNVSLAGISLPFMEDVKKWINNTQSRDASTEFEVLWRVKHDSTDTLGGNYDYLYNLIYQLEMGPDPTSTDPYAPMVEVLDISNPNTLTTRIEKIYKALPKTMEVFSRSLKQKAGQAKQSRDDRDTLDTLFNTCMTHDIYDDGVVTLTPEYKEVIKNDLNGYFNRAVEFMLAQVDPFNINERSKYLFQVIHVFLTIIFDNRITLEFKPRAGPNQEPGWRFKVRNYPTEEMNKIKDMNEMYHNLDTKANKDTDGFLAHNVFAHALSHLNNLDISVTNDSQNISSYSHVSMFVNTMDRVLAKLGSLINARNVYAVMFTQIEEDHIYILSDYIKYKEYDDSLASIKGFMTRDWNTLARDMHENAHNYHLKAPMLNQWIHSLDDEGKVYGSFQMDKHEYRPCMKKYFGQWYYACAWNFPLRILPCLNDEHNKRKGVRAKIGCFDCNMYLVTPMHSFGISPSVYNNTKNLLDKLASEDLGTSDTKKLHAKTNYAMMFAKPVKYQLDLMPLVLGTTKYLIETSNSKEVKEALGGNISDSLMKKFSDLKMWMGGLSSDVFKVSPTKYSREIVSNVIYMIFSGCYYVPRGTQRLTGGQDSMGAYQLAQIRDNSNTRPQRGDMYPTYDLGKMGSQISPIVYSIFYMYNGIMGIKGDVSPYVMSFYEASNIDQKKGRAAFVKAFFANKDKAQGFTIDSKMAALGLQYPVAPDETLEEAQKDAVNNQDTTQGSSSSSSSDTSNLSDSARMALKAAGLLGLFGVLTKCMNDDDLARDNREDCEEARNAIKTGIKDNFKQGFPRSHGWEQVMKKYPDYFAKKRGKWTDAHDVHPSMVRYDRAGNKISRSDKDYYNQSGMSYRQGRSYRDRDGRSTNLARENDQLRSELNATQRGDMVRSREKHREAGKKFDKGGALNWEFTDAQGNVVAKMLPHNIVANVLLLAFAGLTAWGASAGTGTYTRLLDVEFRKGNQKLADLAALQPSRMACSFFFGMGLGIFVAFIASMVEMANHKRVRQALFILMVAVPIVVLGVIGVQGANKMCMENPEGLCPENYCKGTECAIDKTSCTKNSECKVNTCDSGSKKCTIPPTTSISCKPTSGSTSLDSAPPTKRSRSLPTSSTSSRFPRLKSFYNSLMGTHPSDLLGDDPPPATCDNGVCSNSGGTTCTSTTDCLLPSDDVLKDQVKVSDYLFIGLGAGVLVAGICTILPDNPFHPSKFDIEYQSEAQRGFTKVSQVNPKWWVYGIVFSMILAGGGVSSAILTNTQVPVTMDDNNRDVRKSGQIQSYVAIGVAVVLFILITTMGWWHLKRHRARGVLMENYGSQYRDQRSGRGTAAGQMARGRR